MAHNNANHLKRLVAALSFPNCSMFIHLDKKADLADFAAIKGDNVFFCHDRIPVFWGDFSQIRATINLIHKALRAPLNYEYFVLLSGSDYLLRSSKYIHSFFETHKGIEFMSIVKMPCEKAGKPISLLRTYRLQSSDSVFNSVAKLSSEILRRMRLWSLLDRDYRKYFGGLVPYGGSTWWALTRNSCKHILDFVSRNEKIVKYFENTVSPYETFFQTVLGNSQFKDRINRNLTYTDWSENCDHPSMINEEHIGSFEAKVQVIANDVFGKGELLFARKFPDESEKLVTRINKIIRKKEKDWPTKE